MTARGRRLRALTDARHVIARRCRRAARFGLVRLIVAFRALRLRALSRRRDVVAARRRYARRLLLARLIITRRANRLRTLPRRRNVVAARCLYTARLLLVRLVRTRRAGRLMVLSFARDVMTAIRFDTGRIRFPVIVATILRLRPIRDAGIRTPVSFRTIRAIAVAFRRFLARRTQFARSARGREVRLRPNDVVAARVLTRVGVAVADVERSERRRRFVPFHRHVLRPPAVVLPARLDLTLSVDQQIIARGVVRAFRTNITTVNHLAFRAVRRFLRQTGHARAFAVGYFARRTAANFTRRAGRTALVILGPRRARDANGVFDITRTTVRAVPLRVNGITRFVTFRTTVRRVAIRAVRSVGRTAVALDAGSRLQRVPRAGRQIQTRSRLVFHQNGVRKRRNRVRAILVASLRVVNQSGLHLRAGLVNALVAGPAVDRRPRFLRQNRFRIAAFLARFL